MRFQQRIDSGEQVVVGVNAYRVDEAADERPLVQRPDAATMRRHVDEFVRWKAARSSTEVGKALDRLTRAAGDPGDNVFGAVVEAARAGLTNEEMCTRLRRDLGFGHPLALV